MDQLHLVLNSTSNKRSGASPYKELDTLYNVILTANRNPGKVHSILAAIVVLSKVSVPNLEPTPAVIELILGMPAGQVALTLRGMHSVLNIRGWDNVIRLYHTSFGEYLLNRTRSGHFNIDPNFQMYILMRQWLQNLTTSKILTYSPSQLYSDGTEAFSESWRWLCMMFLKPSRDLLEDLWNVDLAFTCLRTGSRHWGHAFEELVPWVREYDGPGICNKDKKEADKNTPLKAKSHSSCKNDQYEAEDHNYKMAKEEEDLDLVKRLVHKFQNRPGCFHLVYPPGMTLRRSVVNYVVANATGCTKCRLGQVELKPTEVDNVRLTDCRCDLSRGCESSNPEHLAYREACWQLLKAYVSLFEELVQSGAEHNNWVIGDLGRCFENMVTSSLLTHCCLDQELLSLCRTFFGLAKGCLEMQIKSKDGKEGRKNMLEWIETFPSRFTAEGEALKAQVRGLPWKRWARNQSKNPGNLSWASDDPDDSHEL
ncbi:hypothetical protein PQX77_008120 [Marasmius sp. AFHP31]|nr:hypothetical protein PQX77_008120 [Marasmius sp. AFHP31]